MCKFKVNIRMGRLQRMLVICKRMGKARNNGCQAKFWYRFSLNRCHLFHRWLDCHRWHPVQHRLLIRQIHQSYQTRPYHQHLDIQKILCGTPAQSTMDKWKIQQLLHHTIFGLCYCAGAWHKEHNLFETMSITVIVSICFNIFIELNSSS